MKRGLRPSISKSVLRPYIRAISKATVCTIAHRKGASARELVNLALVANRHTILRATVRTFAYHRVLPVFFVLVWLMISGLGAKPGTEIPVPEVDFRATVIDDQDISTGCTNVSWEGEIFFRAMRGKGIVTISFERVKKAARVAEAGNGKIDFQITLRDGQVVAVTFDAEARFFGTTGFGTYRISARNIKEIVFE